MLYRIAGLISVALVTMIVVGSVLDALLPDLSGGWGLAVNLAGAVIFFSSVGFTTTAAENGGFRRTWQALLGRTEESV